MHLLRMLTQCQQELAFPDLHESSLLTASEPTLVSETHNCGLSDYDRGAKKQTAEHVKHRA